MIYRIRIALAVFNRLDFDVIYRVPPEGEEWDIGITASEYDYCFEEIPMEPAWPHCRVLRAPVLPEWRMNVGLKVRIKRGSVPDFLVLNEQTFVSEKAKIIIEEVDDFGHQFWPINVELLDKKGVKQGTALYYYMNVRRYLDIENTNESLSRVDFFEDYLERKYLPTIQHNMELRKKIETLPMWRSKDHDGTDIMVHILYMNEKLMRRLKESDITGLDEYSTYSGAKEESVEHV